MANLKITQVKSLIGRRENHRLVVKGLGLKKINDSVVRPDNDSIRGMIFKVKHLLKAEETTEEVTPSRHPSPSWTKKQK